MLEPLPHTGASSIQRVLEVVHYKQQPQVAQRLFHSVSTVNHDTPHTTSEEQGRAGSQACVRTAEGRLRSAAPHTPSSLLHSQRHTATTSRPAYLHVIRRREVRVRILRAELPQNVRQHGLQ